MWRFRDLLIDAYSALSHKEIVAKSDRSTHTLQPWIHADHARRLASYRVLSAYRENVAREMRAAAFGGEEPDVEDYREYGDPDLLISRIVSGILGETVELVVDGADDELPDEPQLPPQPEPAPDDANEQIQRIAAIRLDVWATTADRIIDAWEEAVRGQPDLQARQDWLREWADTQLLEQKMWECETDAVSLGDGTYVLGIGRGDVRLRVYPPDAYFPVLDDEAEARGFPVKVHLAWEFEQQVGITNEATDRFLRVITYELGPIVDEAGEPVTEERRYPWQDADSDPATETCYLTDATYRLSDVADNQRLERLVTDRATFSETEDGRLLRHLDLGCDFIPVVHVPNTPADQAHFGRSSISRVLQLLDDIASTDTDLQSAAALAGTPMGAMSGDSTPATITVKPGLFFGVGANGRFDVIDMSGSVTALQGVITQLLERLSVNIQLPGEVIGRVETTGPESGFARSLKMAPYSALVGLHRLVREHKYRILLKFVQRLAQLIPLDQGGLEPGPTPTARVRFGAFLPSDEEALVQLLTALVGAKVLSRRTALAWAASAGIPIEDVTEELDRIQAEDFAGAAELFAATDDDAAVREYLGLPEEGGRDEEPPPDPNAPPAAPRATVTPPARRPGPFIPEPGDDGVVDL